MKGSVQLIVKRFINVQRPRPPPRVADTVSSTHPPSLHHQTLYTDTTHPHSLYLTPAPHYILLEILASPSSPPGHTISEILPSLDQLRTWSIPHLTLTLSLLLSLLYIHSLQCLCHCLIISIFHSHIYNKLNYNIHSSLVRCVN